jgi:hypothetical protein
MKRLSILLLFVLIPLQIKSQSDCDDSWVYLSRNVRKTFLELHRSLPHHAWSSAFKELCERIEAQSIATTFEEAEKSIFECLEALHNDCCKDASMHATALVEYVEQLQNGKATLSLVDENNMPTRACGSRKCKFKKGKAFCSLLTKELTVCGNTTLNNLRVLGNAAINGDLTVDGSITFNETIIINGDQIINGNLAVSGNGAFGGDLAVAGDTALAGNLAVSGDTTLAGDLSVAGNETVAGNLDVAGDLTVAGTVTFADVVVDDLTVNGTFTTLGPVEMGSDAGTETINIGIGAGVGGRDVNIGNSVVGSTTTITGDISQIILGGGTVAITGTNDFTASVTDDISLTPGDSFLANAGGVALIDAVGAVEINSSAGAINIGNDAVSQPINIGIAGARTITVGNVTGATAVTVNSGTGGVAVNSTGTGDITLTSADVLTINSTNNLNIGVNTAVQNINIGTGIAEKDIIIGNTETASSVTIRADDLAANGITLEAGGFVLVETGTVTAGSGVDTVVLNTRVGRAIFPGFLTAAGAEQEFTITNAVMDQDSAILVTAANRGVNDAQMTIQRVEPLNGSFIVTLQNNGTAALNGDIIITFWILQN